MATKNNRRRAPATKKAVELGRWDRAKAACTSGKSFLLLKLKYLAIATREIIREHKRIARGLGSVILGVPPYLTGQYYQISEFANTVRTDWPLIAKAMDHHVFLGVFLAGVWVFLLLGLYQLLASLVRERPNGWSDAPSILLRSIDNIVGAKEQRFSRYLTNIGTTGQPNPSSDQVFSHITQPAQQLNELIQGIYSGVDSLLRASITGKYVLKVNLGTIDENKNLKGIHFHYPSNHPVRSSLSALNDPNSGIKTAVRTRRMVILESIQVEGTKSKKRFVVTDEARANEDGSLICYPVIYEPLDMVVFVISVHVDQPGVFKQKFANSYEEFLRPFALRIKLEYALLALKEVAANESAQ